MAVLHLNISSLCSHINELKLILSSLNLNFDIICKSESRITKPNLQTSSIHIPSYNNEQTPTEFLTKTDLTSKYTTLNILNSPSLKSSSLDKCSCIVVTVYKHPPMKPYSFNSSFSQLLQKMKKESKKKKQQQKTIITGDFNLSLLNYAKNIVTYEFLESVFFKQLQSSN